MKRQTLVALVAFCFMWASALASTAPQGRVVQPPSPLTGTQSKASPSGAVGVPDSPVVLGQDSGDVTKQSEAAGSGTVSRDTTDRGKKSKQAQIRKKRETYSNTTRDGREREPSHKAE